MLKIRRSRDRLIFNMEIPYLEKTVFVLRHGPDIETDPSVLYCVESPLAFHVVIGSEDMDNIFHITFSIV